MPVCKLSSACIILLSRWWIKAWLCSWLFIRPSSDGTYYGMVMSVRPSGSPSVHPSVRPSVRPSQFSALFSYMLWDIELKFCVSLYFDARKSKFECRQFPSIFAGVMPPFNFKLSQICSFPHFFIRPSSDGTYYGMVMSVRPSGSPSVRPSVRPSVTVFRTFLLHALRYWAEILCITLFWCT